MNTYSIFIRIAKGTFKVEYACGSLTEAELFLHNMTTFDQDLDETRRAEMDGKLEDAFDEANRVADTMDDRGFRHSPWESDGGKNNNRKDHTNE